MLVLKAQVDNSLNSQGVFTNEQAFKIAASIGLQTINVPIKRVYNNPGPQEYTSLYNLSKKGLIDMKVIDPVANVIQVIPKSIANTYLAYTSQSNEYYYACVLVEPVNVEEVMQHQTKNNTQVIKVVYKALNVSKFGAPLGFKIDEFYTYEMDVVPTSNGWKPDKSSQANHLVTPYEYSRYGPLALVAHEKRVKDISFIKNLENGILGKWNIFTDKDRLQQYYIFNENGTYEYYQKNKDYNIKGIYKYNANLVTKQTLILIPNEGRNRDITVYRSDVGMYILANSFVGAYNFIKEGDNREIVANNISNSSNNSNVKLLNAKVSKAKKYYEGFWKSANGKVTIDFNGDNIDYVSGRTVFRNAKFDVVHDNEDMFLKILDNDYNELKKIKIVFIQEERTKIGFTEYFKLYSNKNKEKQSNDEIQIEDKSVGNQIKKTADDVGDFFKDTFSRKENNDNEDEKTKTTCTSCNGDGRKIEKCKNEICNNGKTKITCSSCNGNYKSSNTLCYKCEGIGCDYCDYDGAACDNCKSGKNETNHQVCSGTGKITETCTQCNGKGF
ncbi:MAG: hypothetical protein ACPGR5_02755 [Chitinophagales bacterium]